MDSSIFRQQVLPFVALFGSLIVATVVADALLHLSGLVWVGRYLGIPGTLLILVSMAYSMRKRKLIQVGRPKTLLRLHEVLTWTGALMILVHAGVHVYAILPWLALVAMMVNIISGMTGQYLLDRSRRYIAEKKAHHAEQGLVGDEAERALFWDAVTLDTMKKWRAVHFPITLMFVVLGTAHIFSILLYWQWK